jgi:hypothetical protein
MVVGPEAGHEAGSQVSSSAETYLVEPEVWRAMSSKSSPGVRSTTALPMSCTPASLSATLESTPQRQQLPTGAPVWRATSRRVSPSTLTTAAKLVSSSAQYTYFEGSGLGMDAGLAEADDGIGAPGDHPQRHGSPPVVV